MNAVKLSMNIISIIGIGNNQIGMGIRMTGRRS